MASVATAVATVAVVLAPSASADDEQYLQHLIKKGVDYQSRSQAFNWGDTFCADMRSGIGVDRAATNFFWSFPETQGPKGTGTFGTIMSAAAQYLCPDQLAAVKPWFRHGTGV